MSKPSSSLAHLIGREALTRTLWDQATQHSLPHALAFTGPEGSGRASLARALAQTLLCENPQDQGACGSCPSCTYFAAGTHPDFKEISPEDQKLIKVDRLRQEVVADLRMLPQISPCKIYLLKADYFNEQGQNALLKSLEEPPSYAYFFLTVRDLGQLLPTVVSRISEYKLEPLSSSQLRTVLHQQGFDQDLDFLAAYAQGNPGQALALASREGFAELRQSVLDLLCQLPGQSYLDLAADSHSLLLAEKDHFQDILEIMLTVLRDLALLLAGQTEGLINQDQLAKLQALAKKILGRQGDPQSRAQAIQRLQDMEAFIADLGRAMLVNVNYEVLTWSLLQELKAAFSPDRP